jgi:disulfide bond formation protein DsbB
MILSPRRLLTGMTLVPLLAVAAALFTQHAWGMRPCAWCVMQRLIFLSIAAVSLLGLLLPGNSIRRLAGALALLLCIGGIAAALWQHFVAAATNSCDMTFADRVMGWTGLDSRFPEVFAAYASCADAQVNLAGLPYEFWSLSLFALLALAAARVLLGPDRRA